MADLFELHLVPEARTVEKILRLREKIASKRELKWGDPDVIEHRRLCDSLPDLLSREDLLSCYQGLRETIEKAKKLDYYEERRREPLGRVKESCFPEDYD